jgi:hypothetical protein
MSKYKVGYCRPPENSQFPKGKSGNPAGRPKGSKNLQTIAKEQFLKPVTVTQNGKPIKMPAITVVIAQLLKNAFQGDDKAIKMTLDYAIKLIGDMQTSSPVDQPVDQSPFALTAEDIQIISKHKLLKGVI